MKVELESNGLNNKILEQFTNKDTNAKRRRCVEIFIDAIEHARNGEIKESIKRAERIYNDEENPKKMALSSLSKILRSYDKYLDKPLIEFFNTINVDLELKLPKVTRGEPKTFYDCVSYKELAIAFNITEDTSNHITIHKSKGMSIDNVFVTNNNDNDLRKFLVNSNLTKEEEHRVLYVAMSRARNRLFVHLSNLGQSDEKRIKSQHPSLIINRL